MKTATIKKPVLTAKHKQVITKSTTKDAAIPAANGTKKTPAFSFTMPKKEVIHSGSVTLIGGGKIKYEAARNLQDQAPRPKQVKPATNKNDGKWTCEVQHFTSEVITKNTAILNPQFSKIYLGAIYDFKSIANGEYTTLPYARKSMPVGASVTHGKKAKVVIEHPSSANVAQGILSLTKGIKPANNGSWGRSYELLSEEDLYMHTGGNGYFLFYGGSNDFNFKSAEKTHKYILRYYQAYYTVFVDDSVNEPADFFYTKDESDKDDAISEKKINPNWVYADSVTYGRMLYVVFESDYSFKEHGIDIDVYAEMGFAGGEQKFDEKQKQILNKTKITVGAIGGNPSKAALISNASSFSDLHKKIGDFMEQTHDEVMIGFTLRTLDQHNVGTKMITEFTSRKCAPRALKYTVTWDSVTNAFNDDSGNASEIAAYVRIVAFKGNGEMILDTKKRNAAIDLWYKTPEAVRKLMPESWSFSKGTENNPLVIRNRKTEKFENRYSMDFEIPWDDDNAKIAIRADVTEFDDTSANDQYMSDLSEIKIKDLSDATDIVLTCREDESRIKFKFTITPNYDN